MSAITDQSTELAESITGFGQAADSKVNGEVARAELQENALQQLINGCSGIKVGRFVGNAAEQAQAMAAAPSQATVFNNWTRFSHNGSGTYPAAPAELTAWAYDSVAGQIHNTTNSVTFIGVVSTEKYSDYVLDVSIRSTNSDDDMIGLLLAWYKDPVTGQEYTLEAVRTPGGNGPLWGLRYNTGQGPSFGEKTLADGSSKVLWGNGASGTLSATAAGYVSNTPTTGWSGQATQYSTDGHTRIYATRNGNIITAKTSLFGAPDALLDATLLTVDLSSDPLLAKFQGPSQYGFVSFSQQDSYWLVNQFTNTQDVVFNLATGTAYTNVNGTWTTTTNVTYASLGTNVFLVNFDTGKTFFLKDPSNILEFNTPALLLNGALGTPVLDAIGNYRGAVSQFQTGTLSGDFWGSIIFTAPIASITAPFTTTLDVSNVTERAPRVAFLNNSGFAWTIKLSNNGGISSSQSSAGTTTLVLAPGTTAEAWYSVGGGVLWVVGGTYAEGGDGKVTVSSAAPSGGSPGDTWYQV